MKWLIPSEKIQWILTTFPDIKISSPDGFKSISVREYWSSRESMKSHNFNFSFEWSLIPRRCDATLLQINIYNE